MHSEGVCFSPATMNESQDLNQTRKLELKTNLKKKSKWEQMNTTVSFCSRLFQHKVNKLCQYSVFQKYNHHEN